MTNNKKIFMASITSLLLLAACANSSNESSVMLENESQNKQETEDRNDADSHEGSTESNHDINKTQNNDTESNETNNKEDTATSSNLPDDPSHNITEVNMKEKYMNKLDDTRKETEELEAVDSSTYALKEVENTRWDIWDQLLNEIYGVIQEQLTVEEMDQLREKQRSWIKYRDDRALEASEIYKGGTQEHLEYVSVLANLTEERCYELVEGYMK
ncbi:lysozyme inhibitor LprI family protein [Evansella cellulosilytica]|uniref:Lysozyme inhibitor LprI-like N-terminal domain-containing protein n=1 Tax=Evansella cellulosilytica (strain ATCC 21833 / DSM 2522 / FERM P-1141 / JCM 9156 / N-4) TaxID=649639 RepID=E6TSL8_EVAC2|nr:lysozyme inhibitor LprI family protein [Evansella cellulosilytica]ADU29526.1 hypothetical protein Bcell_1261 [Evansella cellulosilytica DSM 2522]